MKQFPALPGKQAGLSLIELMIASVIGLVILGGAVTVFSSNNSSSSFTAGMARLQESGTVALDIVANGVRMAGFEGCRSDTKDTPTVLASNAPDIRLPDTAIWGSEVGTTGGWSPPALGELANIQNDTVKNQTDVIYLQYASGRSTNLSADMTSPSASNISLAANPDQVSVGDMIMISDCQTAHIFRASGVAAGTDGNGPTVTFGASQNSQGNLGVVYTGTGNLESAPLRVARFEANAFFVGPSGRTTPQGDDIFSLFAFDATRNPLVAPAEMIEGVENIQILYGEQLDNGNIRYVTANNVSDSNNVVSVQIGLLIATADYAATLNDTRTYNVAGTLIGPPGAAGVDDEHAGDRRLRAAFNTTIQLRNRTPI